MGVASFIFVGLELLEMTVFQSFVFPNPYVVYKEMKVKRSCINLLKSYD